MATVGRGVWTAQKHRDLEEWVALHARIVAGIRQGELRRGQRASEYWYVEMNAGDGRAESGPDLDGSPMHALPVLFATLPEARAKLCEIDRRNASGLRQAVDDLIAAGSVPRARVSIEPQDYHTAVPWWVTQLRGAPCGLLFHDPIALPDFAFLSAAARFAQLRRVDFLIYVAARTIKRVRRANRDGPMGRSLAEELGGINKAYWVVCEPRGDLDWTWLIGSNWPKFPDWQRRGFHRIDTPRGQQILEQISLTRAERQERYQRALPVIGGPSDSDPVPLMECEGWDLPTSAPEPMPYHTYQEYLRHPQFRQIRARAMERAAGVCEWCRQRPPREVHHLRYPKWGTFDVPENLLCVCHPCHCVIHGKAN